MLYALLELMGELRVLLFAFRPLQLLRSITVLQNYNHFVNLILIRERVCTGSLQQGVLLQLNA